MFITGQIACQITAALEQELVQLIAVIWLDQLRKEQRILFNIFLDGQKN